MARHSATAGSFYVGNRVPRALTTRIHYGGKASCGGGNALSDANRAKTAQNVGGFVQSIGWTKKTADAVARQLEKMPLDSDPAGHAMRLFKYYSSSIIAVWE